jgi:gamma-glutamyltranspeptidase/glutathione hydrolase
MRAGQWSCLWVGLTVALAACEGPEVGQLGAVSGFKGGVATDEPRASVVAHDALSAGGTAVDAAIAAFFTMSVTYPAGAGLGGGGLCVVYDAETNKGEALEFLAGRPAAGGPYAVPGVVRGLAALHARYGRLQWSQLVSPAEQMARFGHPISRALAKRLEASRDRLWQEPALRRLFFRQGGKLKGEGEKLVQLELATMLSQIRARGAGDLYGGQAGRTFVEAAQTAGATITVDDLRGYRPIWRPTREIDFGSETGHVAPPPPQGGQVLGALLDTLESARSERRVEALLNAGAKAYGTGPTDAAAPQGGAAVVVGDRGGSAAACNFTMGPLFGSGRMAGAAGVLLAPVEGREKDFASPMVVANHNVHQGHLAIASSGGWAAPAATALVALALLEDGAETAAALAAPRAIRLGPGGLVFHEPNVTGADGQQVQALGNVQLIWCRDGLDEPESCRFASDRRGYGLARGQAF